MLGRVARRGIWAAVLLMGIAAHVTAMASQQPTILVMGDSLSAGYGMRITQSWVALLEQRLRQAGYGYRVINASVSGETTGGGRARLSRALAQHQPTILILELGSNDALRGLPLTTMRANLDAMITSAQGARASVLLVGMRIPPNYGEAYSSQFSATFSALSRKHGIPVVDFLLDKVALQPALMQADQLHPTVQAQPILLDNVWPQLLPLLRKP
ncbi:MAG: arylesterase [Steroidobacteraceae bacterium]